MVVDLGRIHALGVVSEGAALAVEVHDRELAVDDVAAISAVPEGVSHVRSTGEDTNVRRSSSDGSGGRVRLASDVDVLSAHEAAESGLLAPVVVSAESHEDVGRVAVVVEDNHVHVEASHGLHDADLKVREVDELLGDEAVDLGVTGGPLHDVSLSGLVGHGDSRDHVGTEIDTEDEDGGKGQRDLEKHLRDEGRDLGDVGGQGVADGLLKVVEDETSLLDSGDDGGEVVVKKDHVGGVLGDLGSHDAHGNANVGLLEGGGVVNTVSGDGDDVALALAVLDDDELLLGGSTGEDNLGVGENGIPLLLGHVDGDGVAGHNNGLGLLGILPALVSGGKSIAIVLLLHVANSLGPQDADLVGNSLGGDGVVSGDHDNLDTGGLALGDGGGDSGAGGGDQGHHAKVDHALVGVGVLLLPSVVLHVEVSDREVGGAVSIGVSSVLVSGGELPGVEGGLAEGKDAKAVLGKGHVEGIDLLAVLGGHLHNLSVDHHLVAAGKDTLGRSLHVDHAVALVLGNDLLGGGGGSGRGIVVSRVDVDVDLVLVLGVKGDDSLGGGNGTSRLNVGDGVDELDHSGLGGVSDRLPGDLTNDGSVTLLAHPEEVDGDLLAVLQNELSRVVGLELGVLVEDGDIAESGAPGESLEGSVLDVISGSGLGEGRLAILDGESVLSAVDDLSNSHDVLGQRSSLVRADAGGGSESLDSLKVLDEDHLGVHAVRSEGEAHGDGGDETLGDVGDDDADHEHEVGDPWDSTDSVDDEETDAKEDGDGRDDVDEVLDLLVDGGLALVGSHSKLGDASHDGVVSDGDDDSLAGSLGDLSSEEAEVLGLEGVIVGALLPTLLGLVLSGKRGLINGEVVGALEDAHVGGDEVSGVDEDDVSRDELNGILVTGLAIPHDEDLGGKHVGERLHETVGLLVLDEREDTGGENNEEQHDTEVKVVLGTLKTVADKAEDASAPKEEGEEVR
mmetsp:Transcript_18870/g.38698  ORF Transcript_18870/g.38698 Transcript_18870/m.38698 type:complete len:959 (+) Transcript_18870:1132-4008(+)